jgi:hypothetical protein
VAILAGGRQGPDVNAQKRWKAMSQTERPPAVDLFDDPAWDSPEARQEAATFNRYFSSLLSPRIESLLGAFGVGMFLIYLTALAMLVGVGGYLFNHWGFPLCP